MDAALYFRSYWAGCAEVADLFESLAAAAAEVAAGGSGKASGGAGYVPHLSAGALEAGLDTGTLLQVIISLTWSQFCQHCPEHIGNPALSADNRDAMPLRTGALPQDLSWRQSGE